MADTSLTGETAENESATEQSCRVIANLPSAAAASASVPVSAAADISEATTEGPVRSALKIDTTGSPTADVAADHTTAATSCSALRAATEHAGAAAAHIHAGVDDALCTPGVGTRSSTNNVPPAVAEHSAADRDTLASGPDLDCLHDDVVASSRGSHFVLDDLSSAFSSADDTIIFSNISALTESVKKLLSAEDHGRLTLRTSPESSFAAAASSTAEGATGLSIDTQDMGAAAASIPNDDYDLNEGIVYHGGARRREPSNAAYRNTTGRGGEYHPNRKKTNGFTTSKKISVPTEQVGRIIGRGGSRIRELEYDSEVKVRVGAFEGLYTDLTLSGTSDAISNAEKTIKSILSDSNNKSNSFFDELYKTNSEDNCVLEWSNLKSYYEKLQDDMFHEYPPILKDFYQEDPEVERAKPGETALWRMNSGIKVQRIFRDKPELRPIPNPALTFENVFRHYPEILNRLRTESHQPSKLQSQAWPILMRGDDLILITPPGSPNTTVYLLPALIHIDGQNFVVVDKRPQPIVLILVPTREMALLVEKEVMKYESKDFTSVCIINEEGRPDQVKIVCKGVDLMITTPDKLNDLILAGHLNTISFSYVVLDGVDKMLELGFEFHLRKVLHKTRPDKQVVLISSVYSKGLRILAQTYLKDPIKLVLQTSSLGAVTQRVVVLEEAGKEKATLEFLRKIGPHDRVLVFCRDKETVTHIISTLGAKDVVCEAIDEPPPGQNYVANVLIGTHEANFDVRSASHLINFDFPASIDKYVEKVSQLPGDGGAVALTLFTRYDWNMARALIRVLLQAHQEVPEELQLMARRIEFVASGSGASGSGRARSSRAQRGPHY